MSNENFIKFLAVYMAATLRIVGEAHAHAVCFLLLPPPEPHCTGTLASDICWPSLETCSNLFTSGSHTGTDIRWLLKHIPSAQADAAHPTGMLSCCSILVLANVYYLLIQSSDIKMQRIDFCLILYRILTKKQRLA